MHEAMMNAVVMRGRGDPDVLELGTAPAPRVEAEEVLVRVEASGVNRADLMQRRGRYPVPPGWTEDILGMEFAGEVVEVGRRCHTRAVGERVMGLVGGGGYAEYVAVHERATVRTPAGMSGLEAGAVPEVFMTAFDAVFLQMGLRAGETILIHAIGSGVGTAALQLARAAGARTLGTSRTPGKRARALELGLDMAVDPDDEWPEAVLAATGGRGVDVILDLVGAPYLAGNLSCLAVGGRCIVVGVAGGSVTEIDLRALMRKRASITGTLLRSRPLEEKVQLARAFEVRVTPQLRPGGVWPIVDEVFPAARAAEAHRRMEENRNFGKIVLSWASD